MFTHIRIFFDKLTQEYAQLTGRIFFTVLCASLIGLIFGGCVTGNIGDPEKPDEKRGISFELPSEWRMDKASMAAFIDNPPTDIPLPPNAKFIKFELGSLNVVGDDQAAKVEADKNLQNMKGMFASDAAAKIVYSEKSITSHNLYIVEFYADMYPGGYYWTTNVFFTKNNTVWGITIYGDRFEHQLKAVEKFLQTFKVEYE